MLTVCNNNFIPLSPVSYHYSILKTFEVFKTSNVYSQQDLRTPPLSSPQIRGGRQQKHRSPLLIEGRVGRGLQVIVNNNLACQQISCKRAVSS